MQFFSITTLAGLLALHGSFAAADAHARHEALHALERHHRHHAREARASRAESSPLRPILFSHDKLTTPASAINKRSFDDVPGLNKRSTCSFPSNAGLVAVSPGSSNGGWAIPPDKQCVGGMYCPYACPSGQVMAQWDPSATSYSYPQSMNGGLKCNSDGTVSKPFPDQPYCKDASGLVSVVDNTGMGVAWCQTQLPGDESMVIPTDCQGSAHLAIPDHTYWAGTSAHYYINPPGVSTSDGCQWGSSSKPHGNWAPYVAGGNKVSSGQVFLKLGWNPIYLEPATPFRNTMPNWGVEVKCDGPGCNGLPCAIDPTKNKVNEMVGGQSNGAGGANFCVVTVPQGVKASIVTFNSGQTANDNGGNNNNNNNNSQQSSSSPAPTSTAAPTTSIAPTTTSEVPTTSTVATSSSASSSTSVSYSYAPHQFMLNHTVATPTAASSDAILPTGTDNGAPSLTSPIASAKASTGAAVANAVSGGVAAAAGLVAILAF